MTRGGRRGGAPRARPPGDGPARGAVLGACGRTATPTTRPAPVEEHEASTAQPPPWITFLWNCDCHTFEEVARQLMKAIGCTYDEGMAIAWRVHTEGKAAVRVGPLPECERVARILAEIGLRVTVVEA